MLFLLAAALIARTPGLPETNQAKRLEWTDPQGRKPMRYSEWVQGRNLDPDAAGIGTVARAGDGPVVAVVVNAELYPFIVAELGQYQADLVAAGYSVQTDTTRTLSHVVLRSRLSGIANITGALLVGELPVAWFEDGWATPTGEEFPIDYFFMDLNGTWTDSDADGLYDAHSGSTAPEIWVGRLYARPLTWDDEVRLVRRYFAKNHAYRTGGLSLPDRALAYVDDDWQSYGNCNLSLVYTSVTTVTDRNTTRASDYRVRLEQGYEWIHVCAHSSPWGHTFNTPSGYSGTVFNTEVYAIRPRAHFYNLFACSGTRFVEENYSAGWDVFQDDYGLAAVGSTKTGSMLYFQDFYSPLGQGKSIGEAFKAWFAKWAEQNPDWFYGMNILGDPTLKPHGGQVPGPEPRVPSREPRVQAAETVGSHPETDDSPDIMCMPDGKVWAIWKSGRSSANGRFDIYAAVRSGGTWSAPYSVGSAYYWETDPALGRDIGNRPVAVWAVFTSDYHYDLYYSVWNGTSWSGAREISGDCSSDLAPSLARDSSGTLWCLWSSRRDLHADIFAASYNGTSWTAAANLTRDSTSELSPCVAATPDGRVWVVYAKYREGGAEICARYRSGGSWHESGPISGTQRRAYRPAVTIHDGQPMVCWQSFDSGNGNICWSRYDGSNWSAPAAVDSDTGLDVRPRMCTDRLGRPWVAWMSTRAGNWDCYTSLYEQGGWLGAQPVLPSPGPDMNPVVSSVADDVWVAWQSLASGNWDIMAKALALTGLAEQAAKESRSVRAWPNPFRRAVSLRLTADGPKGIGIYDATGRCVRTLAVGREPSAVGAVVWDGRDEEGRAVAAGTYFIRAGADSGDCVRVLLLR